MPYYRGDYYRGDYYRGDPGILKAIGKIGGAIAGFVTGGPAGAVAGHSAGGRIGSALEGPKQGAVVQGPFITTPGGTSISVGQVQLPSLGGAISSIGNALLPGTPFGPPSSSMSGDCPRGFHLDKKTRSYCVRNRSTNPLNPRALRRALSRAERFEKIARRTVTSLHRGPAKFKKRGKR